MQLSDCAAKPVSKFSRVVFPVGYPGSIRSFGGRNLVERHNRSPRSNQVERGVHTRPVKVVARVLDCSEIVLVPQKAEEDRLRHVLGIRGVPGDTVGGPEHPIVMRNEDSFYVFGLGRHFGTF
jgi:hypothetical protein